MADQWRSQNFVMGGFSAGNLVMGGGRGGGCGRGFTPSCVGSGG
jgi:hypothetical protein